MGRSNSRDESVIRWVLAVFTASSFTLFIGLQAFALWEFMSSRSANPEMLTYSATTLVGALCGVWCRRWLSMGKEALRFKIGTFSASLNSETDRAENDAIATTLTAGIKKDNQSFDPHSVRVAECEAEAEGAN